jgi:hypothetical protein
MVMTNLFVGKLASNRTPDEPRTLFQAYGSVEGVEISHMARAQAVRGINFFEARGAASTLDDKIDGAIRETFVFDATMPVDRSKNWIVALMLKVDGVEPGPDGGDRTSFEILARLDDDAPPLPS